MLVLEGSGRQAEACKVGCNGADRQVGETPDRPPPSAAADAHIREGYSAALGMAALAAAMPTTAVAKAVDKGDGEMMNDDGGTAPAVLLRSWSNVKGRAAAGSIDAMRMDAAERAGSVVGGMGAAAGTRVDECTAGIS